jgi:hypothetical protein
MSRDQFFAKLPDAASVNAAQALEAFCTPHTGLNVYFTATNGGDLRVRLDRADRTIFTANFQTRNLVFLCRAYCLPETVVAIGIPAERVETPANAREPQRSEFRITSEEFSAHLLEIVLSASLSIMLEQ